MMSSHIFSTFTGGSGITGDSSTDFPSREVGVASGTASPPSSSSSRAKLATLNCERSSLAAEVSSMAVCVSALRERRIEAEVVTRTRK